MFLMNNAPANRSAVFCENSQSLIYIIWVYSIYIAPPLEASFYKKFEPKAISFWKFFILIIPPAPFIVLQDIKLEFVIIIVSPPE